MSTTIICKGTLIVKYYPLRPRRELNPRIAVLSRKARSGSARQTLRPRPESNRCVAVLQTAVFPLHHWALL